MSLFGPRTVKELEDRRNVEKLVEVIKCETSSQIRGEAVTALGRIGGQRAVKGLVLALKDSNNCVRDRAKRALCEIVDRQVPALGDSTHSVRDEAERVLREVVDLLVEGVEGPGVIE